MSDNGASATPATEGKVKTWTDGEKNQLILQIFDQLSTTSEGGTISIKWSEIKINGRTTKSLTHQWANIKKEWVVSASQGGHSAVAGSSATAKATAKKRATPASTKRKALTEATGEDDENESPTRKTKAKATPKAPKKTSAEKAAPKESVKSDETVEKSEDEAEDGATETVVPLAKKTPAKKAATKKAATPKKRAVSKAAPKKDGGSRKSEEGMDVDEIKAAVEQENSKYDIIFADAEEEPVEKLEAEVDSDTEVD